MGDRYEGTFRGDQALEMEMEVTEVRLLWASKPSSPQKRAEREPVNHLDERWRRSRAAHESSTLAELDLQQGEWSAVTQKTVPTPVDGKGAEGPNAR